MNRKDALKYLLHSLLNHILSKKYISTSQ